VGEMSERNVTPQVSQNTNRAGGSAVDERTTRQTAAAYNLVGKRNLVKVSSA
jgi:hypothetical protein